MNPLRWIEPRLKVIFEYGLIGAQFWLAYAQSSWAQSYASTALAAVVQASAAGKSITLDMAGVAANIGAVFLGPQALLFAATKFYLDAKAKQPIVVQDRRCE